MLPKGTMTIDFLPDGTIKVQTGDMGGVDHQSADEFMAALANYMGGAVVEQKLEHGAHHHHEHATKRADTHHHHK
jgi:hypothetical protein